jgi:transcriptional regulator with XRE-family HTH domain
VKSTGIRIRERREGLNMSRKSLAEKLGTTRMTVWRVENGKTQVRADSLQPWAAALETSVAELVAA